MLAPNQSEIVREILAERDKQDAAWGTPNKTFHTFLVVLQEEIGEACHEWHAEHYPTDKDVGSYSGLRRELIQVAAVALEMVESFDLGYCR